MSTVQILFKQYKVLPPRIQRELKSLIDQKRADVKVSLREGTREVRLVKEGKLEAQTLGDLLKEIDSEA